MGHRLLEPGAYGHATFRLSFISNFPPSAINYLLGFDDKRCALKGEMAVALNGRKKKGWWARRADKRDDGSDVKEKLLLAPKTVVMKMHHFPRKHHWKGKNKAANF